SIQVHSKVGQGSTFEIYLPAVAEETAAPAPQSAPADPSRGMETLLLVEDEENVRALARKVLGAHGYTVLEAPDGTAALALVGQHPGRIDLLVTDVLMPGLGGRSLAERLRTANPGLRVLYVSGYTDDLVVRFGGLGPSTAFLQ